MERFEAQRQIPDLKELVMEASRALATLDAARLEELALSCEAFNRELATAGPEDRVLLERQARAARGEMAVLGRVLEGTRGNLTVMNRLGELRAGRLEYGERAAATDCAWTPPEGGHGDN